MKGSMKLQPDDEPRSSLCIGPGSDDAVGFRREFTRRFTEEIRKLAGNTPGDHREKTERLVASMLEATGLVEVNHPYPSVQAAKPPKSAGKPPLQPDDGPRSSLSIGPSSDDAVGSRWEFARRFVEGIGKLTGNTSGDRQKKIIRLVAIMPKADILCVS
ncbi:hypothetical protein GW17_00050531 [Ensete ventricosum]|nr:hypothetical protein GW17_00050531 [Ensete ventricosum]